MVNHRCTKCKVDVGEFGIRHKYASGLFCEPCMRGVSRSSSPGHGFFTGIWGFFKDIWHDISQPFRSKDRATAYNHIVKVAYSVQKDKARDIPVDMSTSNPQKR